MKSLRLLPEQGYMIRRAILQAVYEHGPVSRAQLARRLSLSKPTISDQLTPLLDAHIIDEIGPGASGKNGGRKPILLSFNARCRYLISIDLAYLSPVFVLSDLAGNILDSVVQAVSPSSTYKMRNRLVVSAVDLLLNANGVDINDVFCIGISSPGDFDREGAFLCISSFLEWQPDILRRELADTFGRPVYFRNDAQAAALGEMYSGACRGCDSFLFLFCGRGLGCGLVLNGKLYEPERCASLGCYIDPVKYRRGTSLEKEINMQALLRRVREALPSCPDSPLCRLPREQIDFSAVVEAFQARDACVLQVLRQIGDELFCMTLNLLGFLGLRIAVIGGDYAVFSDFLIPYIQEKLDEGSPGAFSVKPAMLNSYSGLYGLFGLSRGKAFDSFCEGGPPGEASAPPPDGV